MSDPLAGWDDVAPEDGERYLPAEVALALGLADADAHIDAPGRPLGD